MTPSACTIRVPASTSNLGAGFDCLGLALDRYLTVGYAPGRSGLRVERAGEVSGLADSEDLVLRVLGQGQGPGQGQGGSGLGLGARVTGTISISSDIPVGRGLGSSGAAVVAGILLARHLEGGDTSAGVVLPAALELEGHPDNVTPALMGGLVTIAQDQGGAVHPLRHPVSPDLAFAFAAPGVQLATSRARAALPDAVPHAVARRTLARLPALLRGLQNADPLLLRIGFSDELHVPYRLPLIPGGARALDAGLAAGAWAVTISGAGSGLIAVCAPDVADIVAAAMRDAFEGASGGVGALGFTTAVDESGAYYAAHD